MDPAARYAADRAFRRYDAADPENRFVAGELEGRWSRTLGRVAEIEGRIVEHDAAVPTTAPTTLSFDALADDPQAVWSAPTTDARLRKRVVRTVIHEVVADTDDAAAEIVLTIHWLGGAHTEHRPPKRRRELWPNLGDGDLRRRRIVAGVQACQDLRSGAVRL